MGISSWLTADTKESVSIGGFIGGKSKPVYLLQPGAEEHIEEYFYDGYGSFGEVNAYAWLAEKNMGIYSSSLGVSIDSGDFVSPDGVRFFHCKINKSKAELESFLKFLPKGSTLNDSDGFETYSSCIDIDGISDTVNKHIDAGRLKVYPISTLLDIKYPLKFSYNKDAIYEDLPASEDCPAQGLG